MSAQASILIFEEEQSEGLSHRLPTMGYAVVGVGGTALEVATLAAEVKPSVIVIDGQLGEVEGAETAHALARELRVAVVYLARSGAQMGPPGRLVMGSVVCVRKPCSSGSLKRAIDWAQHAHAIEGRLGRLRTELASRLQEREEAQTSSRQHLQNSLRASWALLRAVEVARQGEAEAGLDREGMRERIEWLNTQLQQATSEERRAMQVSHRTVQAKSDLMSGIGQEVRVPLSALLGALHLLGTTELSEEQRELLEAARVSGGALFSAFSGFTEFAGLELDHAELVRRLLQPQAGEQASAAPGASEVPSERRATRTGQRMMIVEDNPLQRKLLFLQLRRLGYEVSVASGGVEAMELLKQTPHDVVLLDLQMPEMDGFETAARIRRMALPVQPRIIAVTASQRASDRVRCFAVGMNELLFKPFTPESLARVLEVEHVSNAKN